MCINKLSVSDSIGESANGRLTVSKTVNLGSNPSSPANYLWWYFNGRKHAICDNVGSSPTHHFLPFLEMFLKLVDILYNS